MDYYGCWSSQFDELVDNNNFLISSVMMNGQCMCPYKNTNQDVTPLPYKGKGFVNHFKANVM
jgi:hypothetical protein